MEDKLASAAKEVAQRVIACYLASMTNYYTFRQVREGLDHGRFKRSFNQVVYHHRYDTINRRHRHMIRVATKERLTRALRLLAENPGQVWM